MSAYQEQQVAERKAAERKMIFRIITGVVLGLVGLILLFGSFTVVDAGERKVILRFGEVSRVLDPGFHLKIPIVESIRRFVVQTQKVEREVAAGSRDLQTVGVTVAVNYNPLPESVGIIYEEIGMDYVGRIVDPAVQDVVKASISQFNAEALLTRRIEVKEDVETRLKERLVRSNINVTDISIVDFQFSAEFDAAIEQKVTAEQLALKAEQDLKRVEFEAQQRIEQSRAEAEAIRIQAQAVTQQGGKDYVELQRIEAWKAGGSKVPMIVGGEGAFLFDVSSMSQQ